MSACPGIYRNPDEYVLTEDARDSWGDLRDARGSVGYR